MSEIKNSNFLKLFFPEIKKEKIMQRKKKKEKELKKESV